LRKRQDGYHDIASLFQAIDLFDRLFFSFSDRDELTCTNPQIPCDSSNLVMKALNLFRMQVPVPSIRIHLEKMIPVQAGLGGGSSNAATVLWGLNELMGKPLSQQQLIEIGMEIGSDVPFFFSSGTAYCTGRGEVITPFDLPSPLSGYIAKPTFGLATPIVFQTIDVSALQNRDPLQALLQYPQFFNDLEMTSFRLEPRLDSLSKQLKAHFEEVVMTGSGSALFCLNGVPPSLEGVRFFPFKSITKSHPLLWYD
jgi:4-diphosphocytidyl-2-C-methyl-D-erythritol kinase